MRPLTAPLSSKSLRLMAVGAIVIAAALSGCARRDDLSTGALPDDYRTRHPIVIAEAEHIIDVPVATGDRRLTLGAREVVRGFAADYVHSSNATVQILVPSGSANEAAANAIRKDVRGVLVAAGVPATRMVEARYQAGGADDAAPIRLSYSAITAKTHPCGAWPEDLVQNTANNRNYENFGCASQANLAAQIANPLDLLGPRAMSPADSTQRGNVIYNYRNDRY